MELSCEGPAGDPLDVDPLLSNRLRLRSACSVCSSLAMRFKGVRERSPLETGGDRFGPFNKDSTLRDCDSGGMEGAVLSFGWPAANPINSAAWPSGSSSSSS